MTDLVIIETPPETVATVVPSVPNFVKVEPEKPAGVIFSTGGGAASLAELYDVDFEDPGVPGQALIKGEDGLWRPEDAASSVADLTDVDLSGGIGELAALRYSNGDQKWRPEMSDDMKNFRGEWEDPLNSVLWSSDFADSADLALFSATVYNPASASGPYFTRVAISSTPALGRPDSPWAVRFGVSTGSSSNGSAGWNFSTSELPVGSVPNLVKAYVASGHSNASITSGLGPLSSGGAAVAPGLYNQWSELSFAFVSSFSIIAFDGARGQYDPSGWITNMRVYGAVAPEDRYQLNDVVVKGGQFYRSLYNDNNHTPGIGTHWIAIVAPTALVSGQQLINLEDVDHSSRADQSFLKYNAATQKYVHDLKPDVVNFKGDWQDSASTLLWSTNFSDPADLALFSEVLDAHANATESIVLTNTVTGGTAATGAVNCARIVGASGTSAPDPNVEFELDTALIPALVGKLVTGISVKTAARKTAGSSGSNTTAELFLRGVGGVLRTQSTTGSASNTTAWSVLSHVVSVINAKLVFNLRATTTVQAATHEYIFTDLVFYGNADPSDLYMTSDVVRYSGNYYRSLFDNNTALPTNASQWVLVGPSL